MKLKLLVFLLIASLAVNAWAQEKPKIDKKHLLTKTEDKKLVSYNVGKANSYYNKGMYEAALPHYLRLYKVSDTHSALNYRIGVSYLNSANPQFALEYLQATMPNTAADYYLQLGKAQIFSLEYDEAKESFTKYLNSLEGMKKERMTQKIEQFKKVCDESKQLIADSVPVFVINMGPMVNSFYDDYSAVELPLSENHLYFTTRRPDHDASITDNPADFKERIFMSERFENLKATEALEVKKLTKSTRNISVSGVDAKNELLFYYAGKKRQGDIFGTTFDKNKGDQIRQKFSLKRAISSKLSQETSITYAPNGDIYFITDRYKKKKGSVGGKDIWFAAKKQGDRGFEKPFCLTSINTPMNEEGVFIDLDGKTLYFSSEGLGGMGGYDVYKTVKQPNGSWSKPENMGYPINSAEDDVFYRTTSDTTVALISSRRAGGFGGLDLYVLKKDLRIPFELFGTVKDVKDGRILGATISLIDSDTNFPVLTATNDTIESKYDFKLEDKGNFFVTVEYPGYKSTQSDPFESPKERYGTIELNFELEKLLHPYTLKGVITNEKTGLPVQAEVKLARAGETEPLFRVFSDANTGSYSFTIAHKLDVDMSVTAPNYYPFSESLPLTKDSRSEGFKDVTLKSTIVDYVVSGYVYDEGTTTPVLGAEISFFKVGEDAAFKTIRSNEETGKYTIVFNEVGPFMVELTAEEHFFTNGGVVKFETDETLKVQNFEMKKMEKQLKIVLQNIVFATGTATLKPESFPELNKLVDLLRDNKGIRIEVSGHTDNKGSAASNKKLSENRALSVKNYLVSQGIATDRIEYAGYGFDYPIDDNTTEAGRQNNRRVEMKIID